VYIGVVGQVVKWFPDKRGFAVGMVAAGYGMGAILTTFPISRSLAEHGHQDTLWWFGCVLGGLGLLFAQGLRSPFQQVSDEVADLYPVWDPPPCFARPCFG